MACLHIRKRLESLFSADALATVLGPAPLSVLKVNNRYRYRVMIYGNIDAKIRSTVAAIVIETSQDKRFSDVSVFADNDPRD
jgi:primosomal protein N' (replication factor Y)